VLNPIHSDPWSSGEEILLDTAYIDIKNGDYEEAIDKIETLLSITSLMSVWRLKLDPLFDPIRTHPRFQNLVQEEK
jgi:hypothetical protein